MDLMPWFSGDDRRGLILVCMLVGSSSGLWAGWGIYLDWVYIVWEVTQMSDNF